MYVSRSSLWDASSDEGSEFGDYAESLSSQMSDWNTTNLEGLLQFEVGVQFNIPNIVIKPSLQTIQDGVQRVAVHLVDVSKTIMWWAADVNESFYRSVVQDQQVNNSLQELSTSVTSIAFFVFYFYFNLFVVRLHIIVSVLYSSRSECRHPLIFRGHSGLYFASE